VFIEAKDDRGGGDNWTTGAISRAKLQSYHHHQQTNTQFFTGRIKKIVFSKAIKKPLPHLFTVIFQSLLLVT